MLTNTLSCPSSFHTLSQRELTGVATHVPACAWHHLRKSQRRCSHSVLKIFSHCHKWLLQIFIITYFGGLSERPVTTEGKYITLQSLNGPLAPISALYAHSI